MEDGEKEKSEEKEESGFRKLLVYLVMPLRGGDWKLGIGQLGTGKKVYSVCPVCSVYPIGEEESVWSIWSISSEDRE